MKVDKKLVEEKRAIVQDMECKIKELSYEQELCDIRDSYCKHYTKRWS